MKPLPENWRDMTTHDRKQLWLRLAPIIRDQTDANTRAIIAQHALNEFGPVPDDIGDVVRKAIRGEVL